MKNLLASRAVTLSIFFAIAFQIGAFRSFAVEGGGGTGGGGTHTCLSFDGLSTKSVELYDLYEAREARRYKLVDPAGKTANELLNNAMKKIFKASPAVAYSVKMYLDYYVNHKTVVQNKEFEIIKDAKIIFIDKGCQYQQIAQWHDDYEAVFIDGSINDLFRQSQLNIAALALHEAVYAYERNFLGAKDSNHARKLVAQAFSSAELEKIKLPHIKNEQLIKANINSQYRIRVNAIKSNPNSIFESYGRLNDCELLNEGASCEFPLEINSAWTQGWNPSQFSVTANKSEPTITRFEVLENGIPIHTHEVKLNSENKNGNMYTYNTIDSAFVLIVPYADKIEKDILAYSL